MRIGLISGEYPPMRGGVGDFTHELALALAERDQSIFVLTDQRAKADPINDGLHVDPIMPRWTWRHLAQIGHWVRDNRLDLVNLQYETAAYAMSAAIHWLPSVVPVPLVTTFHDLRVPYLFPKAAKLREQMLWRLARQSAGMIATDPADVAQLQTVIGAKPIRQIAIGSNIPTTPPPDFERERWRADQQIAADTFLIGYFGFMNANKGLEALIDGLGSALRTGLAAHLVLIGGGATESDVKAAAYSETIRARIEAVGLTDRVTWTGYLSPAAVSAWLLAADVIALPFVDGVSLRRGSFLAAMAHGCPILTTTPESVLTGIEAVAALVPANDSAAIAHELIALAHDPTRRQAFSQAAKRFADRFSWSQIAAETLTFFEQCRVSASHR